MIAVIADDFTGAAELAGICLQYGLSIAIGLEEVSPPNVDVYIVSTDSRSMERKAAAAITAKVVMSIQELNPLWTYKKIDSVLRGHVWDELSVQMILSDLSKAIIIPANPSLGRTIVNGQYFVERQPIHETNFSRDPEFPVHSANVMEMMGGKADVVVRDNAEELPLDGMIIGNAKDLEDISNWAYNIPQDCLVAGGGDFFSALLALQFKQQPMEAFETQLPHLFVSGTAFEAGRERVKNIASQLNCVACISNQLLEIDEEREAWLKQINKILAIQQRLVIAFDDNISAEKGAALANRQLMAKAVGMVIAREQIKELFIEGGATAAEILLELNIKQLTPINEWQRGVVRMKAGDLYITVKPGSYEVPQAIKKLYSL